MKARDDMILRNLAGEYVLLPRGQAVAEFRGMAALNELSAFVWNRLKTPAARQELLDAILSEYDVSEETAAEDLDELLARFKALGLLEE